MDFKEFDEFFARVEEAKGIINKYKDVQEIIDRIFLLENYLKQFGSLEKIIKHVRVLEKHIYLQKEYLSVDEMTAYLCVSKSYIYELARNNQIPTYKPSHKTLFFRIEEVNNWISTHRSMSYDEIKRNGMKRVMEMKLEQAEKLEKLRKKSKMKIINDG